MLRHQLRNAISLLPDGLLSAVLLSEKYASFDRDTLLAFAKFRKTPEAKQLQALMQHELGGDRKSARKEFDRLLSMFAQMPHESVIEGVRRSVTEKKGRIAYVRKLVLDVEDENAPRYRFCTAGHTALEINADGNYTRCPKYNNFKIYTGNVFDDGGIKRNDLKSEAKCKIPCKKRMCFAQNTIRTHTRKEFTQEIAQHGLVGNYRRAPDEAESEVFIRWKLTNTCNYTCSYCSASSTVNKKLPEIDRERLVEVAQGMIDKFDRISLRLTGGEPSIKKNFVELMTFLNGNLDRFVNIEVRTNFSYKDKQRAIFDMDWQGKLKYHIGCHVSDRNFKPWEFVDVLTPPHNVDYVLKFVSTPSNQRYVDSFRQYFIDNGIDPNTIRVIEDVTATAGDTTKVPPAYNRLFDQSSSDLKVIVAS